MGSTYCVSMPYVGLTSLHSKKEEESHKEESGVNALSRAHVISMLNYF